MANLQDNLLLLDDVAEERLQALATALAAGESWALWTGAGLSRAAGLPSWSRLLRDTANRFGVAIPDDDDEIETPQLASEYERAVDQIESDVLPDYLRQHINRLVGHLVGLALSGEVDQRASWQRLLERVLRAASTSSATNAINDLAFAVRRHELPVPTQWLLDLARDQADLLSHENVSRPAELAKAWISLLLAARVPFELAGSVISALMTHGIPDNRRELLEYLDVADRPRSRTGCRLLRDATAAGSFPRYVGDPDLLRKLVGQYAKRHPDLAWEIVNDLGRAGIFAYERRAKALAQRLGKV